MRMITMPVSCLIIISTLHMSRGKMDIQIFAISWDIGRSGTWLFQTIHPWHAPLHLPKIPHACLAWMTQNPAGKIPFYASTSVSTVQLASPLHGADSGCDLNILWTTQVTWEQATSLLASAWVCGHVDLLVCVSTCMRVQCVDQASMGRKVQCTAVILRIKLNLSRSTLDRLNPSILLGRSLSNPAASDFLEDPSVCCFL